MTIRKKLLAIVLSIAMLGGLMPGMALAAENGENLLQNPSFEDGLSGWTNPDNAWAAIPNVPGYSEHSAVHGKYFVWVPKAEGKDTICVYQDVALNGHNPGEVLELSTQTRNWDQTPRDESKIVLKFLDAAGNVLKEYSQQDSNSKWHKLTVSGPLPGGAVKARAELWAIRHTVDADAYYDDVSLKFSGGTVPVINNQVTPSSSWSGTWSAKGVSGTTNDLDLNDAFYIEQEGEVVYITYYSSAESNTVYGNMKGKINSDGSITGLNWFGENTGQPDVTVSITRSGNTMKIIRTYPNGSQRDILAAEKITDSYPKDKIFTGNKNAILGNTTEQPANNTVPTPDNAVPVTVTGGKNQATTSVFNGVTGVTVSFRTSGVIGYRLYRSESAGSLGISVTDFYITANNFTDVNVEPNTTYYYTLKEVLAEADPLNGKREQIGDVLATWTVKTAGTVGHGFADTSKTRHFIMLKIDDPKMSVDGEAKEVDPGRGTAPIILRGRTMVPIRSIVEAMGGNVGWEQGSREVSLKVSSIDVRMWVDKNELTKNSTKSKIDVAPSIINNRTFVPLRFGTENLDCQVDWINSTKSIVIVWSE